MAEGTKVGNIGDGGNCEFETVKKSPLTSENLNGATGYLTPKARLGFTKALILQHFDLECHIWIETNASNYAIGGVLSKLTSDHLGRWHPVVFYLWKMVLAKTWYKTHNRELLAIVEAFKT